MSILELLDRFFGDDLTRSISHRDPRSARFIGLTPEEAAMYEQDPETFEEAGEAAASGRATRAAAEPPH